MGTGTSTLQSIESLSSTLSDIERKLAVIEDSQLHHERTIGHDDSVLVSAKRIQCRSGVNLAVGPVLGLVSHDSVRVLVETDMDAELTLNLFVMEELVAEARFLCEDRFASRANSPVARSVRGLIPNTRYALYVGGVGASDVLLNYATFNTLPENDADVRCLFVNGARVDKVSPGEVDLWREVEERVRGSAPAGAPGRTNFTDSVAPQGPQGSLQARPVHLVVHTGNFLCVDGALRRRAMELVDTMMRDDCCNDGWKQQLGELETALRQEYRAAFLLPATRSVLRRCGNIFVAGQGESGMLTTSFLAMGAAARGPDSSSPDASAARDAAAAASVDAKRETLDELRLLLVAMIERLSRRVYWQYMRQLWDESFEQLAAEDRQGEELQLEILHQRKVLLVKRTMLTYLQRTQRKLLREFDESYSAHVLAKERAAALQGEVERVEADIRAAIKQFSAYSNSVAERPNGACVRLGRLAVVIVETAWGWLTPDGLMQPSLFNRDVSLHLGVQAALEAALADVSAEEAGGPTERTLSQHPPLPTRCIVVAAPFPLLPTGTEEPVPFNEPQMFQLGGLDRKVLLRLCARWQQQGADRCVLLAGACDRFAATGWALPSSVVDALRGGEPDPRADEGWDEARSRLRQIVVGRMDRRAKGHSLALRGRRDDSSAPSAGFVPDDLTAFSSEYDCAASCTRRSFFEATVQASTETTRGDDGQFVLGVPARVVVHCVTDWRAVRVVLGPVVGRVSSTSANVLLECDEDRPVELLCRDKVNGLEHSCTALMRAHRPSIFRFDGLSANHAYDVLLGGGALAAAEGAGPVAQLVVHGSFTTMRESSAHAHAADDGRVAEALRAAAHPKKPLDPRRARRQREAEQAAQGKEVQMCTRLLALGAARPSWSSLLPSEDEHEAVNTWLGDDRIYFERSLLFSRSLVDALSSSWSGYDLVLHCGYAADLMATMDSALVLLARAEELACVGSPAALGVAAGGRLRTQGGEDFTSGRARASAQEAAALLALAEQRLRLAYRLHWGSSALRDVHAHGCHLFVATPMTDLLAAFNAATLRQLQVDLSPFVVEELLKIASRLDTEYQQELWAAPGPPLQLFAGGAGGVFCLWPRPVPAQLALGKGADSLIGEDQFEDLSRALKGELDDAFDSIDTMVIASPIPIVVNDRLFRDGLLLSSAQLGVSYTTKEVVRLLDMLCEWVEASEERRRASHGSLARRKEVVLVCGGGGRGGVTDIYCELLPEHYSDYYEPTQHDAHAPITTAPDAVTGTTDGSNSTMNRQLLIRQLCVGASVGVPSDGSERRSGALYSSKRSFAYRHHYHTSEPHAGLVELRRAVDPSGQAEGSPPAFARACLVYFNKAGEMVTQDDAYAKEVPLEPLHMQQLLDNKLAALIGRAAAHESGSDGAADAVVDAVRRAMGEARPLIDQCHALFREKSPFGLPLRGGLAADVAVMSAAQWVFDRMPAAFAAACPLPSSLTARRAWDAAVESFQRPEGGQNSLFVDEGSSPQEMVTATLMADSQFFFDLLLQSVEMQALLEQLSYEKGQMDGVVQ